MNRRTFTQQLSYGIIPLLGFPTSFFSANYSEGMKAIKKPRQLVPGDTIGLLSPGSALSPERIATAIQNIENLGFKTVLAPHAREKKGFLAGEDAHRLADLHDFFADDQIAGIWCLRGGYGSARLLPQLDYALIRKNPKVLIGYSDITALLGAIYQRSGLVTFHGPVASSTFSDFTQQHLRAVLMNPSATYSIQAETQVKAIVPGQAKGVLAGGNLSLLAALCGTAYEPNWKNKLVFMEDIGEKPYRIDRLLTQLLQGSNLNKAAGILLGQFEDCEAKPGDNSLTLLETLHDRLGPLGIPVAYGMPFGHISDMVTLPLGIEAVLDVDNGHLRFLEAGVS